MGPVIKNNLHMGRKAAACVEESRDNRLMREVYLDVMGHFFI